MSSETLREQLHRTPFYPMTLLLPSGKRVRISNPEFAMFTETGRTLAVFEGERLLLVDVATVEAVETVAE